MNCEQCNFFKGYDWRDCTPNCGYVGGYANCPYNKSPNKTEKGRSRVMARHIDADKFAEAICNFPAIDEHSANAVIHLLRSQSTADVEEVKHARWKGAGMGDYYCSLCCETYSGGDGFAYCPNCGAKMDGGKAE